MIGYAFCGSFCTHAQSLAQLRRLLAQGYEIQPIFSTAVWETDTRFGQARALREEVETLCGRPILHTLVDTEPLGPKQPLQALILCPCTGNTLAKMACGITDSPVCMAAKAHLRADRPLVVALASNDVLSANLGNVGTMLRRKQVFFVPMKQDDPVNKPHSLVCEFDLLLPTLENALAGRQLEPLWR